MSISKTFSKLEKQGALIAYITGGDPSPKYTPKICQALIEGGADILEIGIPFSDPIADGPTIQAADFRALRAGTTPPSIFGIVKEIKKRDNVPIVLLTYYNILYKMGVRTFLEKATTYEVDGLIIPDLPIEEAEQYKQIATNQGIDTIFLVTPSTSLKRLSEIRSFTSGFLYLVSVFGVTGTRDQLAELTTDTIRRIHPHTAEKVPLAVGFGISKPEHIKKVMDLGVEGAIVGSAFVKVVEKNLHNSTRLEKDAYSLACSLKAATLKRV